MDATYELKRLQTNMQEFFFFCRTTGSESGKKNKDFKQRPQKEIGIKLFNKCLKKVNVEKKKGCSSFPTHYSTLFFVCDKNRPEDKQESLLIP